MRVTISRFCKVALILMVSNALSLFKPLDCIFSVFGFDYAVRWVNLLMIFTTLLLMTLLCKRVFISRFILTMVLLVCATYFSRLLMDFAQGRNIYKEMNAHCTYLYIVFAVVIYDMLKRKTITLNRLIDVILILTLIGYLLRVSISVVHIMTGKTIFHSIAVEGVMENWVRNDRLRVGTPCLNSIIIPLCYYQIIEYKSRRRRIFALLYIAFVVWYNMFIVMGRSGVLFSVLQIAYCVVITKKSTFKDLLLALLTIMLAVILFSNGLLDYLFNIFSVTNKSYGYSNNIRMMEYPYFLKMVADNFWIGKGLLISDELYFPLYGRLVGGLADCGILRSLVFMGLPMLIFFVLWLGRGMILGMKTLNNQSRSSYRILALGILASILIYLPLNDCFLPTAAFVVPFALAIPEYVLEENRQQVRKGAR